MEVFDRAAALERFGGDAARLEARLESFQKDVPETLRAIERALKRKRTARIEEIARELQVSSHDVGAEGLSALALKMIEAAKVADFDDLETLLTHMGMELDWLLRILDENRCSGNL